MRFVLLGDDPAVLPLVRAIAEHPEHALERAALVGELQGELMRVEPALRIAAGWDELLAGEPADAAIVGGHSANVLLAARQLAQTGTPLVLFPDVRQGAEFVYELTLIRDDSQVVLAPVFPWRFEAAVRQLGAALRSADVGKLLHLVLERECAPGGARARPVVEETGLGSRGDAASAGGSLPLLAPAEIDARLLHDADLLRSLGGDYNQVTAFHAGRTEGGVASATVSLAGENLPEASWSLKAAPRDGWRIAATTERETISSEGSFERAGDAADAGARILKHVEHALAGQRVVPDWTDLTRAFEIVQAGHRSVARRRTIDLHFETTSERSLFKSQMTALGCGLLWATLLGVVVLLVVGAVFRGSRDEQELRRLIDDGWTVEAIAADPERLPGHDAGELRRMLQRIERRELALRIARIVVFAPLAVFLALQLLVFVARPSSEHVASRSRTPAGDS